MTHPIRRRRPLAGRPISVVEEPELHARIGEAEPVRSRWNPLLIVVASVAVWALIALGTVLLLTQIR